MGIAQVLQSLIVPVHGSLITEMTRVWCIGVFDWLALEAYELTSAMIRWILGCM